MEDFWRIVSGWPPLGQGFFLLVVISMLVGAIRGLAYYCLVLVRGWPPEHAAELEMLTRHGRDDEDTE